jgi:hypothetical protein
MVTKNRMYLFLLSLTYVIPALSMKSTISHLELFPGKGKQSVLLPAPYRSWTDCDRKNMKIVQEGNVCTLKKEGDCALVGPIHPCLMDVLHLGNTTVVGHVPFNADISSFIDIAKQEFEIGEPDYALSKITGTIFTNHCTVYEDPCAQIGNSVFSWKDFYQGRTQREEIKKTKDTIVDRFGIKDRAQIDGSKFISKKKDYELGNYELAELYILVKHNIAAKPSLYSTCPMAENMENFRNLPIPERLTKFEETLERIASTNPYRKQFTKEDRSVYGKFPFVKI